MHAMHATLHAREAEVIAEDLEEAATAGPSSAATSAADGAPHTLPPLSFPGSLFYDHPWSWDSCSRSLLSGSQPMRPASLLGCSMLAQEEAAGSSCSGRSEVGEGSELVMAPADSSSDSSSRGASAQGCDSKTDYSSSSSGSDLISLQRLRALRLASTKLVDSSGSNRSHSRSRPASALGLCEGLFYGHGFSSLCRMAQLQT